MNEGYMDVLRSIASSEPTPGGGSVAALSLARDNVCLSRAPCPLNRESTIFSY